MPDLDKNTSGFLSRISQFIMPYSPSVVSRATSKNLAPVAKAKRRQELGLNSQTQQKTLEPAQKPAAPKPTNTKPVVSKPAREKVSAVGTSLQTRKIDGGVDFKSKGAISTAAGGNTDYSLGYTPGLIKYKGSQSKNSTSDYGLKADTSGLKAEKPMAAELTKKQMRKAKRVERLENRMATQRKKGVEATSEGRFIDAKNKNNRISNLQKRIDRNKSK